MDKVSLISGLIITILVFWKYVINPLVKNRVPKELLEDIDYYLKGFIKIAEYVFDTPNSGKQKKQWVLNQIEAYLGLTEDDIHNIGDKIDEIVDELYN